MGVACVEEDGYAEVRRESGMHRCEGKFKDASVYSNETGIYCNKS